MFSKLKSWKKGNPGPHAPGADASTAATDTSFSPNNNIFSPRQMERRSPPPLPPPRDGAFLFQPKPRNPADDHYVYLPPPDDFSQNKLLNCSRSVQFIPETTSKPVLPKKINRARPKLPSVEREKPLNNLETPPEDSEAAAPHFDDIKKALQDDRPELAVKKTKEILENAAVLPLAIAITGESGAGKSSLVNALRGVEQSDSNAAPTDVVETTMVPTPYEHPQFPTVTVWDLPGVGTTKMTAASYLEYVGFKKYDFFIIVSNTRFRENDANLALEIKKMKKNFYFVRSKIDQDIYNAERSQRIFNKQETLKKIRDNCINELQNLGITSPKVFLLSSFERLKFDFNAFVMTLEKELSANQRESLLRAVPSYSLQIIEKKKALLAEKIPGLIAGAVFGGLLSFVSIGINEAIMRNFAKDCLMTFGLTEQTLELLSQESKVPVEELKAVMKLSLDPDIGAVVGQVFNGLLLLTSVQVIVSGVIVNSKLHHILNITADDAQNVLKKALGLEL